MIRIINVLKPACHLRLALNCSSIGRFYGPAFSDHFNLNHDPIAFNRARNIFFSENALVRACQLLALLIENKGLLKSAPGHIDGENPGSGNIACLCGETGYYET